MVWTLSKEWNFSLAQKKKREIGVIDKQGSSYFDKQGCLKQLVIIIFFKNFLFQWYFCFCMGLLYFY